MPRRKAPPAPEPFLRKLVIRWDEVADRESFPWCLPLLRGLKELDLRQPVIILVGENGSGKSTLMEGIAEAAGLNVEGGSRNHNFSTTRYGAAMAGPTRVVRGSRREKTEFFLRAESFYNVATYVEERGIDALSGVHRMSHGEGFLEVLMTRLWPNGLYLFDEPESALSPQNQLVMLRRLHQLVDQGCQIIMSTHSPILMAYPGARIYGLDGDGIQVINCRDTSHFAITRRMVLDPDGYLKEIFAADEESGEE